MGESGLCGQGAQSGRAALRLLYWLLARLQERRTYIGLAWLLTVSGVTLRPDLWDQVMLVGMAIAGLLEVIFREPPIDAKPQDTATPDPVGRADDDRDRAGPGAGRMRVPVPSKPAPRNNPSPDTGFGDR